MASYKESVTHELGVGDHTLIGPAVTVDIGGRYVDRLGESGLGSVVSPENSALTRDDGNIKRVPPDGRCDHKDGLTVHLRDQGDSSELVSLLVNQGAQVEEVRKVSASLEEAFVTLMKEQEA